MKNKENYKAFINKLSIVDSKMFNNAIKNDKMYVCAFKPNENDVEFLTTIQSCLNATDCAYDYALFVDDEVMQHHKAVRASFICNELDSTLTRLSLSYNDISYVLVTFDKQTCRESNAIIEFNINHE